MDLERLLRFLCRKPELATRVRNELRLLMQIGFPVVIGNLLQISMSVVDTLMAGNLSPRDLAAVAVGSSLFMPVMILGSGILMAVSPIVAQHFGGGRLHLIGKTTRQSMWLAVLISIPAMYLFWNMDPVLRFMNVEPEIVPLSLGYLKAISFGVLPLYFYLALKYFHEGVSITKPAMYISFLGLGFNIFWNYTLMYGKFGFPRLGAIGTGYASAIVMTVMFIALVVYTYKSTRFSEFDVFKNLRLPERTYIFEILKIGIPIGISMCMEVTMFATVGLLMGSLGTYAVAGHQIAINFASITFMIAFGLSAAITVRVGHVMGRSGIRDAGFTGKIGVVLSSGFMVLTALFMFMFPEFITGLYTDDHELQKIAVQLIYLAAIFQLSDGLQVSGFGALRGLKDTKVPMMVNLIAYWIVGLPLGYYFGIVAEWGPQGLWIGLIAGLTVAAILHNTRFHLLTRKRP